MRHQVYQIDNQIYQTSFTFIDPTTAIIDNSDIVSTTFNLQDLSSALFYTNLELLIIKYKRGRNYRISKLYYGVLLRH